MAKARFKPEELLAQGRPTVATLPDSAPATPFLDPGIAQAEPQGSELYNLGTVQQSAASTRDADMFNPSYLQEPQNYPTGAEGGIPQPQGASPLLYPTAAETQPKLKARLKPNEALALAEVNRPRRKSPDEMMDELAVGMFDPSKTPLPQDLWGEATQRRSKMIQEGRLPMEFGEIDSLADGLVWTKDAAYGAASYIAGTLGGAAAAVATNPAATARQLPATIGSAAQRTATEFGLQTYQDIFNLTHEPKYRVKETGEFVAVNKTGLPLVMPAASGGNNVLSGDGIIDPRMPEQGIRSFAEQGKTLVPVTEQDLKDYRYGQYLDRMAMGAQSLEAQNFQVPSNLAQQVLATSAVTAPLAAFLAATDPGGTVGPNQAQAEVAVLAAQSAVPMGAASRSWGISRRVAGGLSKVAGAAEGTAGFFPDVETALRAKFVKTVTSGTNLDAGAQKTALQAAIDGGKTLGIAGGAYAAATGLSAIDGVPGELKQAAWTAANLYSGYKGGMFVARQLRSASGFAKTVLKEVADPAQGLDVGARMRVAANPDVPDFVRNVLRSPSSFRAMESTPARLAKNQALSPAARAVFGRLSDYRFVQAARLAKDTAAGVPKGMVANVPFVAGAMASDDPERAGQMLAAGGVFGAMGGAAGRFTEARQRSVERAEGDIARLLVDIQAGNELGSGLGGDIMRNRVRPGTQFQDGPGGFVLNPDREVSSFLTEVEMAGGDVSAFVRGKSFDELAQWAAYQGFFRDKVDLVPLNATDFKLNAEANGQNGAGAYFLQPSEGRRARVFVNAESRRNGLAPHEYGHAVLRGGALSPDQIDAVHAEINARYAPDALRNMAGEYAATMVRAENAKQGINIEPSPAAITAKVNELSQGSMIKGSADGLDWLREEIFAEEFRNANIDMNRARRNIPLGANPVSFFENLLGAQSRALHMAGIDIDPQTGKPMGRDQIFKENRVAAGDPVVMKNYEDYVKQWRRWINDPTHEADPGVPLSKTGNVRETADSPNVTWKDYGRGRMETEFAVKNPDGSVTPKDWNKEIKPTVRARQQAVREMSNRSKEVAAADDQTFGMRRRRDGRLETSGRRLPDSFFFIPQYKPFHDILRKINAADDIGETLQVRFFAKGKSKDVFKDGIKNTSAVNREALHGNFVAKKDGTLMWGWLDMTQFRNRAMKAIADRNPALSEYDWNLKAIMDDLPVHLTDQRRGKGGAFSVGPERANILNGLIGIGDGPLVGAFGKGTAYKTIHLDSIDAIVPTGKTGGEFDVYRANRNAMPDDPKPPVDMETDADNNRMPQQIPREARGMPDVAASGRGDGMPSAPRRYVPMEQFINEAGDDLGAVLANAYADMDINEDRNALVGFVDTRNSMYRQRIPVKEFFDWLHSDEPMRGLVFDSENKPATAGEGASYTREGYEALLNRLRDISLRKPKPSAAPRAQAMPNSLESAPTDQLLRQYEENQGYLGLSTLGMREGRPVRGGAAQTRELLRRNEAISAELERRGVREEDPQLQRALQRRGQAMPDVSDGLPRRDMQSRGKTDISNDGTVTYSGKEPKDWSPQDFAGFGKDFGVRNLGPLSKVTTITDSVGRTLADIPGGIEGKFTYYDLLWLKANPVDVGALPLELHGKLTAKLARTMTPERGNDVQKFNGILFGMLSPNSPLLPNEFGQARMRFGSMDEIKKFAGLLPDNPTKEQRKSVNQRLKKELGFTSAKSGGLGIGISVDLSNIVMAAKLFVKKPDFFIKKPNESWANFVDKLTTQVSGLGTKTASFGGVWQDPLMAGISAMDRHMARAFSEELIKNPDVRGRFEGIVVKRFNDLVEKSKKTAKKEDAKIRRAKTEAAKAKAIDAKTEAMENLPDPLSLKADTLDDVLGQAEVFGADRIKNFVNEAVFAAMGSRKAKYTVKGGAINPNLPESLQGVEWVEAPKDFQVMSDAYRSALEINAQQAKRIGIEIFPSQWTLWDRIRGRVEPHEAMFPGLERLPALNDRQLGAAYAANKQAGYARNVKAGQEWKRKSGLSPSSLAYFTPAVLAAGAALSQEEQ
jgi:hypothetical protein